VDLPIIAVREPRRRVGAGLGEPAGTGARLDGLRVLVVDDHGDARDVLALVLRERGADVHLAAGVAEALDVMARATIDVIVSDLAMPGADGYQLIAAVRAARGGDFPAVALTAYAGGDVRERAIAAGFSAHATKPLDPEDLIELIVKLPRG
jgi:CheY-like chemotaxis protein